MNQIHKIEQTGKKWKALQALGIVGVLAGVGLFALACVMSKDGKADASLAMIGVIVGVVSFPIHLFGRVGGWWYYG